MHYMGCRCLPGVNSPSFPTLALPPRLSVSISEDVTTSTEQQPPRPRQATRLVDIITCCFARNTKSKPKSRPLNERRARSRRICVANVREKQILISILNWITNFHSGAGAGWLLPTPYVFFTWQKRSSSQFTYATVMIRGETQRELINLRRSNA